MEVKERNPGGDATGLVQSMQANGPDSLLRAENVGAVVRTFLGEVFDTLDRAGSGQISRSLGIATVQSRCNYYAGIFSGRLPSAYKPDPQWHPAGLAKHLRGMFSGDTDEAVIAEAFASVAKHAFSIAEIEDEAAGRAAVDELVASSVGILSGMHTASL